MTLVPAFPAELLTAPLCPGIERKVKVCMGIVQLTCAQSGALHWTFENRIQEVMQERILGKEKLFKTKIDWM